MRKTAKNIRASDTAHEDVCNISCTMRDFGDKNGNLSSICRHVPYKNFMPNNQLSSKNHILIATGYRRAAARVICAALAVVIFAAALSGCNFADMATPGEVEHNTSYKNVHGVTAAEISAVDKLRERKGSFIYAATPSTDAFYDENGDVRGFAANYCGWLSDLFEMPFTPVIYLRKDMGAALKTGKIDFAGKKPLADDRLEQYHTTNAIAERPVKMIRLVGSEPFEEIAETRPVILAFLHGSAEAGAVESSFEYNSETIYIDSVEEACATLHSGAADAFFSDSSAEAVFIEFDDVVYENYLPLVISPVYMTALNPDYAPIISIVQKALESGSFSDLSELYNKGYDEFHRHAFYKKLDEDERAYIRERSVVPIVAQYYNYPISFYNDTEKQWQGIVFDLLEDISYLTGLTFNMVNGERAEFAELQKKLESGEAAMITRLVRTPEREGLFLWTETSVMEDKYILISDSEYPFVNIDEIPYRKVGIVKNTAQGDLFRKWFPESLNTIVFDGLDDAFGALDSGKVDMVMSSLSQLLFMTNYNEITGYKANVAFSNPLEANIGFNINETALRSIFDKALRMIDTEVVAESWLRKTYDYQAKLAQARQPWLIGIAASLLCVLLMLIILFLRRRHEGKRLKEMVYTRTVELEAANKTKSEFLANMSHELRTPLNVIVGLSNLRMDDESLPDDINEDIKKINHAGDMLLRIVNDILDISKIESGNLTLVPAQYSMAGLLDDIIALNMSRNVNKPVSFIVDINGQLPRELYGDELRLKQIFNNLLSNAFKYTKEGVVTLGVYCSRESDEYVAMNITVSDTGIGIKKDDMEKIFSDFSQADARASRSMDGTGLGLPITKKLVNLMDGEITVDSEFGKGSSFHVRLRQGFVSEKILGAETADSLRRFTYTDARKHASAALTRNNFKTARVLVVDDVKTNLDVAAGMMSRYKMAVDGVMSGQAAIDLIAGGEPAYDAVFMDHMMPGMDGVEATRIIREEIGTDYARDIPIIMLTANALAGNEEMFLSKGFQAFLSKPIDIVRLDEVIRRWVQKSDGAGAAAKTAAESAGAATGATGVKGAAGAATTASTLTAATGAAGFVNNAANAAGTTGIASAADAAGGATAATAPKSNATASAAKSVIKLSATDTGLRDADGGGDAKADGAGRGGVGDWQIDGLDIAGALRQFGDKDIVLHVLNAFTEDAPALLEQMRGVTPETLDEYAITAHGLKGCCFGIYAHSLGEQAKKLEDAAKAGQYDYVEAHNADLIGGVETLAENLRRLLKHKVSKMRKDAPDQTLLSELLDACRLFDINAADKAMSKLAAYEYDTDAELVEWLAKSVRDMNFKLITRRLSAMLE